MAGRALVPALVILMSGTVWAQAGQTVPLTRTTALDGHSVLLPQNLGARATVLIVGFSKHSSDATTAWEKPVRTRLAQAPAVGFYDIAMLAEVPGFVRPIVLRSIRHQVPEVLQTNFLTLTSDEDAWKRFAGFSPDQPDAAYVLLVDGSGRVSWSTHMAFTDAGFAELSRRAHSLAGVQ